jgi:hypothetical protein
LPGAPIGVVGIVVIQLGSGLVLRPALNLVGRPRCRIGRFRGREEAPRPDDTKARGRVVDRPPSAGSPQRILRPADAPGDLGVDERAHHRREDLVRRQGPVALHREVAAREARPPAELPHDPRFQAPGAHERRLHGHHPDLLTRRGTGLDEDRCAVGPRPFAGTRHCHLERAPGDRRCQQPDRSTSPMAADSSTTPRQ